MLPLGHRFNPIIARACRNYLFVKVPWGDFWLTIPSAWVDMPSSASAPIYQAPRRQSPEFFQILEPLLSTLAPGCIVDVGANVGLYTLAFRHSSQAPIIAFEPDTFVFSLLSENVQSNDLSSVILRNVACGDAQGRLLFNAGINGSIAPDSVMAKGPQQNSAERAAPVSVTESGDVISVPVVRLDDELRNEPPISLIKIDCEGYEWNVLNGCQGIIEAMRPTLFIELHTKFIGNFNHTLADVCDRLRPYYQLEFWETAQRARSLSPLRRFFGRYRQSSVTKLHGEAHMLALSKQEPVPDQFYLVALPRGRH